MKNIALNVAFATACVSVLISLFLANSIYNLTEKIDAISQAQSGITQTQDAMSKTMSGITSDIKEHTDILLHIAKTDLINTAFVMTQVSTKGYVNQYKIIENKFFTAKDIVETMDSTTFALK